MWQVKVSHKSEMAGPFNRVDTIINKHFCSIGAYSGKHNTVKPVLSGHSKIDKNLILMTSGSLM